MYKWVVMKKNLILLHIFSFNQAAFEEHDIISIIIILTFISCKYTMTTDFYNHIFE